MKRILSFLAIAALVALSACHPEPILSVSPDSLSFSESGGSQTVQITANYPWTASVSGAGFSVSPSSGEGSGSVTVTAAAATSSDAVTGTLSVRSEGLSASVSLSQDAKPTIILGDAVKVPAEGGPLEISVQYNTDYTVEIESSAQSWIKFIKTKALSSGKLEFEIAVNEGGERSGKVTVKGGKAAPVSVTVIQEAERKVLVVGNAATVPAEGGTVEVDIQYNVDYTVEVEPSASSWIHYVETKAPTNGKLVFKIDPNEGTEERMGEVTLKDISGAVGPASVTITQKEKTVLKVGEPTAVSYAGGSVCLPVEYNTDYTVEVEESAQSWIRIIRTKAVSNGQIELYVSENKGEERSGKVTVTDVSGKVAPIVLTIVQRADESETARRVLMELYYALDGPNWTSNNGWGSDAPLYTWDGVNVRNDDNGKFSSIELLFNGFGLKGSIPDCIGDLTCLTGLRISNEPGLTGTLPQSFANLVNLDTIDISNTSMTGLPDVFGGMKNLSWILIYYNRKMVGPLPESFGKLENLISISMPENRFEGSIPESWAKLLDVEGFSLENNHLSGKLPDFFFELKGERLAHRLEYVLQQADGYGFDITDVDIPGYWPLGTITDFNGETFSFADVVKKNKYTVYLSWAAWCPFSSVLMPQVKEYYENYRQDGLEIIATVWNPENVMQDNHGFNEEERKLEEKVIRDKGYGMWYNFYFGPYYGNTRITHGVPVAEVYDNNGNVLFSTQYNIPDPVRKRYGREEGDLSAYTDLIPFLETLFGPAEIPDSYVSTDFSKDGEVMTLQKATAGKGINIVFMGDAYTDRDMGVGGLYETVMKQAMEEFFAIEPYKTFRDRFNVYAVKVVSKNGRVGSGYSTALGTVFKDGTEVDGDRAKCYDYAGRIPGLPGSDNLLITVMINTRHVSGTAYMSESLQSGLAFVSSIANDPEAFGSTLRHESGGHAFGFLADEYSSHNGTPPQSHIEEYTLPYEKYGWFANVDFTNDPSKVRWRAFLSDERYKDEIGIFEGGALYPTGAYRPSKNSMMNENMEYFNAPSRLAIYKRIMELSGEGYSFEKFLEYDAVNRGKGAASAPRPPLKAAAAPKRRFGPTAPPVIVP